MVAITRVALLDLRRPHRYLVHLLGRARRGVALRRRTWIFSGSDRGGECAAAMYSLIVTEKLNGTDPRAWLVDVLRHIGDHPNNRLANLLPWNWRKPENTPALTAA